MISEVSLNYESEIEVAQEEEGSEGTPKLKCFVCLGESVVDFEDCEDIHSD